MPKKNSGIPVVIQSEIQTRVDAFNVKVLSKKRCKYSPVFKGKFVYLMRSGDYVNNKKVCRLTYNGDIDGMDFAIYKYSTDAYDPGEIFPGDNFIDGTVEGAMKACLEAYPV